ncbi:MAG: hypothetical protein NPMRTH1_420003 [Nitrosopumilales archaeon]|nr:MAG: hypothetical protein NPMRTH1_420003 [Nitrosopumilales archaeon]
MSRITTVGIDGKYEPSLVFEDDESIVQFLLKKIPQIGATMIIDREGNLIKHTVSKSFESEIDPHEIEYIAKLIGLRYRVADFHKIRNGLQMTINVFKGNCIIVTSRNGSSIIAIMTKSVDIEKIRQIISQIK